MAVEARATRSFGEIPGTVEWLAWGTDGSELLVLAADAGAVFDDRLTLAGGNLLVAERAAQLLAALIAASKPEQLVFDLVDRAFGSSDFEQASGIALDA